MESLPILSVTVEILEPSLSLLIKSIGITFCYTENVNGSVSLFCSSRLARMRVFGEVNLIQSSTK